MSVRSWFAAQLGHPRGAGGHLIGSLLNRNNRRSTTEAVAAVGLSTGRTAVDIGFGGGVGLGLLLAAVGSPGTVHGVDISATMLARAGRAFRRERAGGQLHLHEGSITALPLGDRSVDAAITINTIYFVADLDQAFAEVARVLRPEGRVVVGLAHPAAMARTPIVQHGFRVRPVAEVIEALTRAGLAVDLDLRVGESADAYHLLVAHPAG